MPTTYTPNLNLAKPDGTVAGDFVDIGVLNDNADKLDAAYSPDFVSLVRFAAQNIPSGVGTSITWDTETEDTGGYHAGGSTDIIIPAGRAGLFLVTILGTFEPNAGGTVRSVELIKNGGSSGYLSYSPPFGGSYSSMPLTAMLRLADADTLSVKAYQNSGGNLNCAGTKIQVTRLHA